MTAAEAKELEPLARTHEVALWSPTTASAGAWARSSAREGFCSCSLASPDPGEVMSSLVDDAVETGVDVCCGAGYVASEAGPAGRTQRVTTAAGDIEAGHVVNCAGLYADRVARDFGVGQHYHIMPFKGLYLYLERDRVPLRRHVYPTPDLANPFLGVHFTVTVDGEVRARGRVWGRPCSCVPPLLTACRGATSRARSPRSAPLRSPPCGESSTPSWTTLRPVKWARSCSSAWRAPRLPHRPPTRN